MKNEELNIPDLHRILSVEKSTSTRLVNPLIQKGFLTRQKSSHDSRAFVPTLTKEGRNAHQNVQCFFAGGVSRPPARSKHCMHMI
jgi:DNA-binding MarR family transcriptional regulator